MRFFKRNLEGPMHPRWIHEDEVVSERLSDPNRREPVYYDDIAAAFITNMVAIFLWWRNMVIDLPADKGATGVITFIFVWLAIYCTGNLGAEVVSRIRGEESEPNGRHRFITFGRGTS